MQQYSATRWDASLQTTLYRIAQSSHAIMDRMLETTFMHWTHYLTWDR